MDRCTIGAKNTGRCGEVAVSGGSSVFHVELYFVLYLVYGRGIIMYSEQNNIL